MEAPRSSHREGGDRAGTDRADARRRGIDLFTVLGVRIRLDPSWFLIFALIFATLAFGHFPQVAPASSALGQLLAGLVAALAFFGSILVHELAHCWTAKRAGLAVEEITLFVFGGVSRITQEARTPGVELWVAISGPLTSFALAALFLSLAFALGGEPVLADRVLSYLGWTNVALGVFNMLPGYPLDGGRVLRAMVWRATGSLRRATKVASRAGSAVALLLATLGALQVLAGALVGGLWMIVIAIFLRGLAKSGYEELVLRNLLADVEVERVMIPSAELVTVAPDLRVSELLERYFLEHGYRAFPVVEGGRTIGLVSADDVRRAGGRRAATLTVREVMAPADERTTIPPHASMLTAVERMRPERRKRLLVVEDGHLEGLLSQSDISRFVEVRSLLQEA
jgi:Zn-dependent protease/CBS domain-containing protein